MPIAYIARLIYFIMIGNSWVEAIYSIETIDLGLSWTNDWNLTFIQRNFQWHKKAVL